MTNAFVLDPELGRISDLIAELPVSELRLMKDGRFLWVMLIPQIPDVAEWHELSSIEMATHAEEIRVVSKALELAGDAEVINVGMFGHGVRQLHVHMAARHSTDSLWPQIAFMTGPPEPRNEVEAERVRQSVASCLQQAALELESTLLASSKDGRS